MAKTTSTGKDNIYWQRRPLLAKKRPLTVPSLVHLEEAEKDKEK